MNKQRGFISLPLAVITAVVAVLLTACPGGGEGHNAQPTAVNANCTDWSVRFDNIDPPADATHTWHASIYVFWSPARDNAVYILAGSKFDTFGWGKRTHTISGKYTNYYGDFRLPSHQNQLDVHVYWHDGQGDTHREFVTNQVWC